MYHAAPWDLIPFFVTFIVTLRSSSAGLLIGIFTHLIIALGKFIMPIGNGQLLVFDMLFQWSKFRTQKDYPPIKIEIIHTMI